MYFVTFKHCSQICWYCLSMSFNNISWRGERHSRKETDEDSGINNYNEVVLWHESLLNSTVSFVHWHLPQYQTNKDAQTAKLIIQSNILFIHNHFFNHQVNVEAEEAFVEIILSTFMKYVTASFICMNVGIHRCFQDDLLAVLRCDRTHCFLQSNWLRREAYLYLGLFWL